MDAFRFTPLETSYGQRIPLLEKKMGFPFTAPQLCSQILENLLCLHCDPSCVCVFLCLPFHPNFV